MTTPQAPMCRMVVVIALAVTLVVTVLAIAALALRGVSEPVVLQTVAIGSVTGLIGILVPGAPAPGGAPPPQKPPR